MAELPNDSIGDVAAWGLTPREASRYFGRLSEYHAKRARRFADEAVRLAHKASSGVKVAFILVGAAAALQIAAAIVRLAS
jgi:hypothetical protein